MTISSNSLDRINLKKNFCENGELANIEADKITLCQD